MTDAPRQRLFRYANPYAVADWTQPPAAGTQCEPLRFETVDRAQSTGLLYSRGGEDTVVCVMHPRADFSRHYVVPPLLDAGMAVLCQNSRWLGNDSTLVHERLLLDVAAGVAAMRQRFDRVVLCGNSGGGSLYTFYLSQALVSPAERLTDTAAGDPLDLREVDLPHADAMIYLAAHVGEGHFLLHCIDPSVAHEHEPTSCEPSIDAFDPANGFVEPPGQTRYAPDFLERYRRAQRSRVARLDALARHRLERRRTARERWATGHGSVMDRRTSIATDYLVVQRTDADPRTVDLSLDPSDRDYGSIWGYRPDWINYGAVGFGRVVTPEAWLSTWSGLSSRASIELTGRHMTLPALVVSYRGDNGIFPSDTELIVRSLGSSAVERVDVGGDHYGWPANRGRGPALEAITDWLHGLH